MNGTMNVVTGFSLGVLYEFDDQGSFVRRTIKKILDFKNLAKYVRVFFENMRNMYVNKIIVDIFPLWARVRKCLRKKSKSISYGL